MEDITEKFEVEEVAKSRHWPAWKGDLEQVHLSIKRRSKGSKAKFHLYVPATHKLAKATKGAHIAIFIHPAGK